MCPAGWAHYCNNRYVTYHETDPLPHDAERLDAGRIIQARAPTKHTPSPRAPTKSSQQRQAAGAPTA